MDTTPPLISPFKGCWPQIEPGAFVDLAARLIGQVLIAAKASVWPGAVLRADEERISLGPSSAVLDLALLEAPAGRPVLVEEGALISHKATLHGAMVRAGALVGIGAIVLDGAEIGPGALVGAGALVTPRTKVPARSLVLGSPAKVIRELKPAEERNIAAQVAELQAKVGEYLSQP